MRRIFALFSIYYDPRSKKKEKVSPEILCEVFYAILTNFEKFQTFLNFLRFLFLEIQNSSSWDYKIFRVDSLEERNITRNKLYFVTILFIEGRGNRYRPSMVKDSQENVLYQTIQICEPIKLRVSSNFAFFESFTIYHFSSRILYRIS